MHGPASPGGTHSFFFFLTLELSSFSSFGLFLGALGFSGNLACWQSCRAVLAPHPTHTRVCVCAPALQTHFTSFSVYASFRLLHSHHVASVDSSSSSDSGGEVDSLTCSPGVEFFSFI